jgi:hypothetical protein
MAEKATLKAQNMVTKQRSRRGFGRVEQRANGRYRAAYTGPDRQLYRAPMTFGAKDDAIAWLSARRAEIEMQVWAPEVAARGTARRSVPTLHAYEDIWLEARKTKGRALRSTTRVQYRMLLAKFIYPTFGETRIDRITNEDVNVWYDTVAPGRETIRAQSYSLLRTIFGSAASEPLCPLIPYNPARIAVPAPPRGPITSSPRRSRSYRRSSRSCPATS